MATMDNTTEENKDLNKDDIVVLGVPSDSNSSFMKGSALAPARTITAPFCIFPDIIHSQIGSKDES